MNIRFTVGAVVVIIKNQISKFNTEIGFVQVSPVNKDTGLLKNVVAFALVTLDNHHREKEKPMRRKARISTRLIGSIRFMCVLYSARNRDASLFCAFFHAGLHTVSNPGQDHLYVLPGLRLRVQDHLVDGFVEVRVALLNLLLAHGYIITHFSA